MRRKPLWVYGIMCLVAAALPSVVGRPPANAQEYASRLSLMLAVSAVGFALIGWSAVTLWRDNRKL
jgi:hypothetical protein